MLPTCRECGFYVTNWAKHKRWHQGIVCDCGHGVKEHPINWHNWANLREGDSCTHSWALTPQGPCSCREYKPRLAVA